MAEETIYLCNFRVSVDGDWLCLKELADVHLETNDAATVDTDRQSDERDPKQIERANLLNMSKMLIKELIDSSLAHGRMLDDDYIPLQQFFVVLEHVLIHGLKGEYLMFMHRPGAKKGILSNKKEFWWVLESIEKTAPEAAQITTSAREMPNIRTPLGRARAWMRLALMQKSLADYFKLMIENRDTLLHEFYEPGAFMLEEEGMVLAGLLISLNVLDCNMCIKGEDLDQPMGVIDFSLYMRDGKYSDGPEEESDGNSKLATILDQKNYLEELNRHLTATVNNLQQKLEMAQADNCLMKEDLAAAKNTILTLQSKLADLSSNNSDDVLEYQESAEDVDNESKTGIKTEVEEAMKLLEKDISEKEHIMTDLQKQLDDIKAVNLSFCSKLQTS